MQVCKVHCMYISTWYVYQICAPVQYVYQICAPVQYVHLHLTYVHLIYALFLQISVVLSVDKHQLTGLVALLQSLWQHTSHVDRLRVYIVVLDMTSDAVLSFLACHQMNTHHVCVHVRHVSVSFVVCVL